MIKTPSINTDSNTNTTQSSDKRHYEEWVKSGVSDLIITRNFRSIYDALEVDKLLNRNTRLRWKHSNNLVPCWAVSGVDPLTGERTHLGCQIKPNTQVLNREGKLQKYIGASGYETAPLFLDTGISNFWKAVIDDKSKPIILTEGAKKAGCGLSNGYATISIPGVSTCRKNGRLHNLLKLFTGFGRTFYLCFDNDVMYKRPVQKALLAMARELSASGSKVMVIVLPPGEKKGMDDFISNNGKEEFDKLFVEAQTIEEWRKKLEEEWQQQQLDSEEEEDKCSVKRQFQMIKEGWGEGLRFNELKTQIELAGEPLNLEHIRLHLALEFNQNIPLGDAQSIVDALARKNTYSPVVEYLDSLELQYPNIDTTILNDLATRYFGSDEPLHNIYMKKTLIAAVARARHPGCKHDNATIIVGKQGWYKSTFWKVLFGEDWFSDELGDANERDELMKLHRFWGLEWSEFETVYRRKDVSSLKKFMTSTVDAFRTPYARSVKEYPRSSVLVGTTNETDILADPTGSRRFWIISLLKKIPVDLLRQERDRLWAAANALYQAGEAWDLTSQEGKQQEILNQEFHVEDPWENAVSRYLEGREYTTTQEVLLKLEVETSRQDVAAGKRVRAILRRLGWMPGGRKRVNGDPLRVWIPENKVDFSTGSNGSTGSLSEATPETFASLSTQQQNFNEVVDQPLSVIQQEIQSKTDPVDPVQKTTYFSNDIHHTRGDTPQMAESDRAALTRKTAKQGAYIIDNQQLLGIINDNLGFGFVVNWLNGPVPIPPSGQTTYNWERDKEAIRFLAIAPQELVDKFLKTNGPWKPVITKPAIYGFEKVTVVGYDAKTRQYQIEFKSGRALYVKASKLSQVVE